MKLSKYSLAPDKKLRVCRKSSGKLTCSDPNNLLMSKILNNCWIWHSLSSHILQPKLAMSIQTHRKNFASSVEYESVVDSTLNLSYI